MPQQWQDGRHPEEWRPILHAGPFPRFRSRQGKAKKVVICSTPGAIGVALR